MVALLGPRRNDIQLTWPLKMETNQPSSEPLMPLDHIDPLIQIDGEGARECHMS